MLTLDIDKTKYLTPARVDLLKRIVTPARIGRFKVTTENYDPDRYPTNSTLDATYFCSLIRVIVSGRNISVVIAGPGINTNFELELRVPGSRCWRDIIIDLLPGILQCFYDAAFKERLETLSEGRSCDH